MACPQITIKDVLCFVEGSLGGVVEVWGICDRRSARVEGRDIHQVILVIPKYRAPVVRGGGISSVIV